MCKCVKEYSKSTFVVFLIVGIVIFIGILNKLVLNTSKLNKKKLILLYDIASEYRLYALFSLNILLNQSNTIFIFVLIAKPYRIQHINICIAYFHYHNEWK